MTGISFDRLQGWVSPFGGTVQAPSTLSEKRPHAAYGPHGLQIELRPIKGLTPSGVFEDEKPFQFQVAPIESFGEDGATQWNDYNTVGSGQHSTAVGESLRTISFDTVFLDWQPAWAQLHKAGWAPNPRKMVAELTRIRRSKRPFLLLASQADQSGYDVNYAATLRTLHWELRAGEVDAYYVSLAFVEFVSPDVQSFIAGSASSNLPVSIPMTQVVASGATFASLAKQFYGDPSKANVIAAANGITNVSSNTLLTSDVTDRTKILVPQLASSATKAS